MSMSGEIVEGDNKRLVSFTSFSSAFFSTVVLVDCFFVAGFLVLVAVFGVVLAGSARTTLVMNERVSVLGTHLKFVPVRRASVEAVETRRRLAKANMTRKFGNAKLARWFNQPLM